MSVYTPALSFATNGTWNRLLFDGSGGLVVGYGVTNQGTDSFPRSCLCVVSFVLCSWFNFDVNAT